MDENTDRSGSFVELRTLIEDIGVAMLTTRAADGTLHSRPMVALDAQRDGTLWFLTRRDSGKAVQIATNRWVNLAYAAPERDRYVSVSGTAVIVRDDRRVESLWTPACAEWLPGGPRDPNLVLVRVTVNEAKRWNPRSARMEPLMTAPGPPAAPTPVGDYEPVTLDTSGN